MRKSVRFSNNNIDDGSLGKMNNEMCFCGERDSEKLFSIKRNNTDFRITKCKGCGVGKTTPSIPNQRGLEENIKFYKQHKKDFQKYFQNLLTKIKKFKTEGRMLDIGCNLGFFLELSNKEGFDIMGVESNSTAASLAKDLLGEKKVHSGRFEDINIKPDSFDIIVLNQVLEHMENPLETIKKCKSILKENGLLVLGLPDFGSVLSRLKGKDWRYLVPEQHVWHFTKENSKKLLEENGFDVLECNSDSPYFPFCFNPFLLIDKFYFELMSNVKEGDTFSIISRRNERK